MSLFPKNLLSLHRGEEELYFKSLAAAEVDSKFLLHMAVIEVTMDMLDIFRQYDTDDEDTKAIQMLTLRLFNAFASGFKLMMSGYYQNSAHILRDILETVFLLDYFRTNRPAIMHWRTTDKKTRKKAYQPAVIREALDDRDGFKSMKRAAIYELFSELAAHPNINSIHMLRPKNMDARNGPFFDNTAFFAVLSEMGRLAIQVGEILEHFFPKGWQVSYPCRQAFRDAKPKWIEEFYSAAS